MPVPTPGAAVLQTLSHPSLIPWEKLPASEREGLAAAARENGLAPLLYLRLRESGQIDSLEPATAAALEQTYHEAWALSIVQFNALERVLLALSAAGMEPVLLKGAGLALTVYEHPATRPMVDLDLLVGPDEFRPALDTLLGIGWTVLEGEQFDGAYQLVSHHAGLYHPDEPGVLLELHHQWLSLPQKQAERVSIAGLQARAERVAVGKAPALILGPEDQLLHLCGHIAIHLPAVEKPIWYCDVDRVIRRMGARPDWQVLLERAVAYAMVLPLQLVLPAVADALGSPIPEAVRTQLAGLPVTAAERRRYGSSALSPHSRLGDGWQKLGGLSTPGDKVRFAWRMIFPNWTYMRRAYPTDRGLRLAGRYGERWLGVLREYVRVSARQ